MTTIETASELVDRAEINGGTVLVEYSRTEAALVALRAKFADAKFDLTTTAGDKAARAARLELVTLRTGLEKKRKELKAPAVEFGKKIDDEAKRINSEILALEEPIDQQIKADEKRREAERLERERLAAERAAGFRAKIDAIRACVTKAQGLSSDRISDGIAKVEAIATDAVTWEEFASEAEQAKTITLAAMRNLRDLAKVREEEAARIEAQRLENERIAAEQRAAAEALAAQQKALAEQAAAIAAQQKALDDAKAEEVARIEREQRAEAARLEREAAVQAAEHERQAAELREAMVRAEEEAARRQREEVRNTQVQPAPVVAAPVAAVRPIHPAAQAFRNEAPTLKLGTICERLGFTVSAAFLAELGFDAYTDKGARLYRESQFGDICNALNRHIDQVAAESVLAA